MSNALTLSQPGMWEQAHADAVDAWQAVSRHVALTEKIARYPQLAGLLDEAMMALDDGVPPGPFTAAADVLRGARARTAEQRQAEGRPDGEGRHGPQATFTGNGHAATTAQVTS